ncbi:MAG: sensor histidine kinase [Shimia sp.]
MADHRTDPEGPDTTPKPTSTENVLALRAENDRLRRELTAARAIGTHLGSDTLNGTDAPPAEPSARLALLEAMLETAPVGVVLADARGRIVHGNAWVERMLKHPVLHSADTESYGEWVSFHADGRRVESHEYPLSRVILDGEDHSSLDVHYQRGDGTMFWMRVIGEPVHDADGNRIGATVALVDIDEERRLLDEKEVLLGEVNHRVKNSLQIVSAILSMQARGVSGEGAEILQAASVRVRAVAAVHAALYHDDDVRTVEFGEHLRTFCTQLADGAGAADRGIALDVEAERVTLPAETAVPLSLIVNELVTNAFKYAFPLDADTMDGIEAPRVRVGLTRTGDGHIALEVSDNGRGSGGHDGELTDGPGGLGSTLVATLARQLHATVSREREDGWTVRLVFEA